MPEDTSVCVIIAAKNAASTIARAISSALAQKQVSEVIVVDDGSDDATSDVSRRADDGTERLRVISFDTNKGPAAARNHAISMSQAPLIAILDADDMFLEHRFDRLLLNEDWDLVADNIVFADERDIESSKFDVPLFADEPKLLGLRDFVLGNISRRSAPRGETGFLKPVMRRSFLDAHDLRYDESLRLGEDYDLYARALLAGARFKIVHSCGYAAVVRANSLSGQHATDDLRRLALADRAILADHRLSSSDADAIGQHERHVRARYHLREFLDRKNRSGLGRALVGVVMRPSTLTAVTAGVASDKAAQFRGRVAGTTAPRKYLFSARPL